MQEKYDVDLMVNTIATMKNTIEMVIHEVMFKMTYDEQNEFFKKSKTLLSTLITLCKVLDPDNEEAN